MKAFLVASIFSVLFVPQAWSQDELIQIENLWITQDIHVAADFLCQDGQSIYFNNEDDCKMATQDMSCGSSQPDKAIKIGPLRFIEQINLPGDQQISQFFSIKTEYEYLRFEVDQFFPVRRYALVESRKEPLPICKGMRKLPPKKVVYTRDALPHEVPFFQGLLTSGVLVLNSPFGVFTPETIEELDKGTGPVGKLPSRLRSPLCNKKANHQEIILKASGGWSGNGITFASAMKDWQEKSTELFMVKSKDEHQNDHFKFYCMDGDDGV